MSFPFESFNTNLNLAGSIGVFALGAALLFLRNRTVESNLLAMFAISWGLGMGILNTTEDDSLLGNWSLIPLLLTPIPLLILAARHPARQATRRWGWWAAGASALLVFMAWAWTESLGIFENLVPYEYDWFAQLHQFRGWFLGMATTIISILHLSRYRNANPAERRELVHINFALGLYTIYGSGTLLGVLAAGPPGVAEGIALTFPTALTFVLATLWLMQTKYSNDTESRLLRIVFGAQIGGLIVGTLVQWQFMTFGTSHFGIYGLIRFTLVAIIARGILKHHMFGLDITLRRNVSKSALAAIFISAFFIASEAAQQFFGDRLDNNYLGIAFAGLLVFAISPLHRFTDGITRKVLPGPGAQAAEQAFVASVEAVAKDGTVSHRDLLHLQQVAFYLEIAPARSTELQRQVLVTRSDAPTN